MNINVSWLYRFGDGYRIKIRMKEVRGNDSMKEFMRQNFPEATLNVSKTIYNSQCTELFFVIGGTLQYNGIPDPFISCQTGTGVQISGRSEGVT